MPAAQTPATASLKRAAATSLRRVLHATYDQLDRWQVQVLGRVLRRAEVWLHTDGLDDDEVRAAHLRPVADVTDAVAEALAAAGTRARLGILPQGPLTVVTAAP